MPNSLYCLVLALKIRTLVVGRILLRVSTDSSILNCNELWFAMVSYNLSYVLQITSVLLPSFVAVHRFRVPRCQGNGFCLEMSGK